MAEKLGDIFLTVEADSISAFWRGTNDTKHVQLCTMLAPVFNEAPPLRDRFLALASEIAAHHHQRSITNATPPWWSELECATCKNPQAADVLHQAAQVTELSALQLSPSGRPAACCHVKTLAAMGAPDMPSSAPTPRAQRLSRRY
jgi:hypothetical protein